MQTHVFVKINTGRRAQQSKHSVIGWCLVGWAGLLWMSESGRSQSVHLLFCLLSWPYSGMYLCFPSGIFHSPALWQGSLTERAPILWLSSVVELRTGSVVSHGWALNESTWVNKSLTWNFCWNSLREVSEQGKWTLEVWVATRLPPGKNRLRMIPTVPRATASLLAWYHESSFVLKSVWEASRAEDSARWPSSQRDWYPQVFPFCFQIRHWRPFFSGQGVTSQVG